MSEGVTIQVTYDDGNLKKKLSEIAYTLGHLRPAMQEIGMAVEQLVMLGFNDGRDPYGNEWPKPAFRYFGQGAKKRIEFARSSPTGATWRPLRDTGRLMNSITHNADNKSVRIGTNILYAPTHQLGLTVNAPLIGHPVKIRQRRFLPDTFMPTNWNTEIMATLNDYLRLVLQ